jgi:glycosyltransferase involved in cell wall biosynthesis
MTTSTDSLELTILMPCLNESRTLGNCIDKGNSLLASLQINGEIVVADNGSTDGSQLIATACGARVIDVSTRGYGAALIAGIEHARGRYIIMGDSDESYDFAALGPFVEALRAGNELVMGNRFAGGIAPDAMPFLHRYLGNPVLSFIGRLFFKSPVGDFHCGLRGFHRDAITRLGLRCEGMEFASEMIVKASLQGIKIAEVPTTLSKDGRDRPPHLRTWRDGWRHLRFLLLFTPRWLLLYPGIVLTLLSLIQLFVALMHPNGLGRWPVGVHTQLFAVAGMMVGFQTMLFASGAILARHSTSIQAALPRERLVLKAILGPSLPIVGATLFVIGVYLCVELTLRWGLSGFGALEPAQAMRQLIPGVALVVLGAQSMLAAVFFSAVRSAIESSYHSRVPSNVSLTSNPRAAAF